MKETVVEDTDPTKSRVHITVEKRVPPMNKPKSDGVLEVEGHLRAWQAANSSLM